MARGSASNLVSPAFLLAKPMSSATRSTGDFPRKRLTNGECECVLGGWGGVFLAIFFYFASYLGDFSNHWEKLGCICCR